MIKEEFQYLGEIWRDITAIEFLMRCAIAKNDGDVNKMPKPPYTKGKIYSDYSQSFSHYSFEIIVNKFNKRFPQLALPEEIVSLRDALAHGLIVEINHSGVTELVKFKETKQKQLAVEFHMEMEMTKLLEIKKSLRDIRRSIVKEVDENRF